MKCDHFSDEELIREVQRGYAEYFRMIVDRYQDRIFSMGMRFFHNRDDSSDFAQEVFLRAYDKIGSYRAIAPFKFWLSRLAYNHGLNLIKARKEENIEFNEAYSARENISPESLYVDDEIKKSLLDNINSLPERYRICLDLYFFMGLKYSQIGEITGYPVNTIKSDVFRAKKILRQKLRGTIVEEYDEVQ